MDSLTQFQGVLAKISSQIENLAMDALELLQKEHEDHRQLLARLKGDEINRKRDFKLLRETIIHHVNMEEAVFFPSLLAVPHLKPVVKAAWLEHDDVMGLLKEMDAPALPNEEWHAKFMQLHDLLMQHTLDEEEGLFKEVKNLASSEFLIELAKQMQVKKIVQLPDEILYPEVPGSHEWSDEKAP